MTISCLQNSTNRTSFVPLGGQSVLLKNDQASEHPIEREEKRCFLSKKLSIVNKKNNRDEITMIRRSQSLRSG